MATCTVPNQQKGASSECKAFLSAGACKNAIVAGETQESEGDAF